MKRTAENIIHVIIFISTILAIAGYFGGDADVLGSKRAECFKYFTTDSNVLACIASSLCLYFSGKRVRPHWVEVFRFVATVAVTITFVTVVLFLAPVGAINGKGIVTALRFFKGNVFVLHFSTPVLSIIAMMIAKNKDVPNSREATWAVLPVIIYSLVYLVMVVFVKAWKDWYGFTFGGKYAIIPLVMLVMYSANYGIARLELWARKKIVQNGQ